MLAFFVPGKIRGYKYASITLGRSWKLLNILKNIQFHLVFYFTRI